MSGIIEGIKVIDMGHFVAVPAAAAVLADWGADVLKVEPLAGEPQRGVMSLPPSLVNWRFEVHNRNKRSIALDLKQQKGRDILYALVRRSDVFMSNYEQGALARLKADYQTLSKQNPRLVYALLTGYGTEGPQKNRRGFDISAAWAGSGIQYLLGEDGNPPPTQRGGLMDRTAGFQLVAGVLAALLYREKTGKGQLLELSLYHSGVWTLAADLQVALGGLHVAPYDRARSLNPLAEKYLSKDGRWLQLVMLQADIFWHDFCTAVESSDLESDPRFNGIETRAQNSKELMTILDRIFSQRNADEWEKRLTEHNCIYSLVRTPEEVIADPQAAAGNFFTEVEHPITGKVRMVTSPVRFHDRPATLRKTAPETGQH
ncbi:MAG: CoA transferase, partial [Dehalococcoidales bacterium]|nr:CoA transferase [Dehalococcoidales bacterium]